jgi:hypothetical protein
MEEAVASEAIPGESDFITGLVIHNSMFTRRLIWQMTGGHSIG